jgi:hypothetical protein
VSSTLLRLFGRISAGLTSFAQSEISSVATADSALKQRLGKRFNFGRVERKKA